jgi:hypothetical protein
VDTLTITKTYRISVGLLILVAIITQTLTFRLTPIDFFSYFTVLSNLLVSIVFLIPFLKKSPKQNIDFVRGAATLYKVITGLGFIFLLGGRNDVLLDWVNIVFHYIAPLVMLIDWIFTPSRIISFKESIAWIIFPIMYFIYSMIRGSITSWYPYEFINPNTVGYMGVFNNIEMLFIIIIALMWVMSRLSGRHSHLES